MSTGITPISVLFVCTGNICRSPTAEGVFRRHVEEAGLSELICVDSAGTHGYHIGDPPDSRAIATALARGVDLRDLRARKLEALDFERFDYLFAMDSGHNDHMARFGVGQKGQVALFLCFPPTGAEKRRSDVPDPYYGTQADFDLVYNMVEEASARILAEIRSRHSL